MQETKETRDVGWIPGLGRSPGGGHGNPLQYPCLENPMGRGAWQATVHWGPKELDRTEVIWHARGEQPHPFLGQQSGTHLKERVVRKNLGGEPLC